MCRSFFWGQKKEEHKTAWVAWDKLIVSKKEGGLGMRDLLCFNKAMLAKQVWRLITNTNSLMVRTLKQKYFPHTEFMETKATPTASYTWKSILSARDVVRLGACKLVLPRALIDPAGPNYVHELCLEGECNYQLIDNTFVKWKAHVIKKIPLSAFPHMDRWTWQLTKTGDFTVKSAYFAFLHSLKVVGTSSSTNPCNDIWEMLWNANVPPKVKNFGWRALHGGLPVRSKLKKRGICDDDVCPVCGENAETIMHSLFFCPVAKSICFASSHVGIKGNGVAHGLAQ
uniref:Reverse transcriptase zinc-binding domain-containing protein n=1 Tax=Chenopodium quinoa TaxID=63459 RepID=A0A803LQM6_CHEQI